MKVTRLYISRSWTQSRSWNQAAVAIKSEPRVHHEQTTTVTISVNDGRGHCEHSWHWHVSDSVNCDFKRSALQTLNFALQIFKISWKIPTNCWTLSNKLQVITFSAPVCYTMFVKKTSSAYNQCSRIIRNTELKTALSSAGTEPGRSNVATLKRTHRVKWRHSNYGHDTISML